MADDFVPSEIGLSDSCAARIVKAVTQQCNKDSWAAEGENRMHECLENESGVYSDSDIYPTFWLAYTAGDADVYSYKVEMTNKAACQFRFTAEN
jgi:hypothetical protein